MGVDASIYGNMQPAPQVSLADNMEKAMHLGTLGIQQQQMQKQIMEQQALRQAYSQNTGQDGSVNKQGVLSDLGKQGYGHMVPGLSADYAKQDKEIADAHAAQADAASKALNITGPAFDYLYKMPEDKRPQAWSKTVQQLKDQGVDVSKLDHPYDPQVFSTIYGMWQQSKPRLENVVAQSTARKNDAETGKALADTDKIKSETYKRNPDILGQTNDPAKLVPGYVPKEHQAKAFSEIDAAENTKRMAAEIMRSFDGAAEDNTVLKTGYGMIRTPATVMALHQALQPTFKDLEGTVRQAAMDNTFKNITPAPGDSAKTVATKRQALEEYLQSKASAPTARAYGIDLSKFDSTSAYKSDKKDAKKGVTSFGGPKSAMAGTITPEDAEAIHWAKKNSSDPRAKQILAIHGEE